MSSSDHLDMFTKALNFHNKRHQKHINSISNTNYVCSVQFIWWFLCSSISCRLKKDSIMSIWKCCRLKQPSLKPPLSEGVTHFQNRCSTFTSAVESSLDEHEILIANGLLFRLRA